MRPRLLAPAIVLIAATATAATVNDYYGKWSRGDCGEEWVLFADGKVTQFSSRFQAVETAENPSAVRKAAPAPRPAAAAPKPPEPAKAADAAPAAKPATTDPANPDQPRNPATARKLIDSAAPRNPATARRVTDAPAQGATAPASSAPPAPKASPKSKEMALPATLKLDGDRLSVETQEQGRKPRREVYAMADRDTLVLQDTYVDGRRIPPITRDQITYKRCK
ncbi:MAG: hypothetical protein IT562_13110 [Alphaproteobacteria bacterium]|nr:hypothetical protein [Alphaproteobacteria bacterium]